MSKNDTEFSREYETDYQKLIDNANEGIWIVDSQYQTIFVNQKLADILGLDPEEMIGKPVDDFFYGTDQKLFSILKERRLKGFSDHYEIKFTHRDGSPVWTTISAFPIKDSVGTITGAFAVVTDTTERLQHEKMLNQYRIKLEEIIDKRTGELRQAKERLEDEIQHRIQVEKELRALNAQLIDEYEERKELSKRLIDMLEKDRLEIASHLHDQVGQILATLRMDMEKLINQTNPASPGLIDILGGLLEKVDRSAFIIKNIARELRPITLDRLGLVPSLRILLKKTIETSTMEINFHHDNIPCRMQPGVALTIYRTVQESLNNIVKYSQARTVHVSLALENNNLSLAVEDDGLGFNAAQWQNNSLLEGSSFGLSLMRERILQYDGDLIVESTPGNGTLIMAHIPLESL